MDLLSFACIRRADGQGDLEGMEKYMEEYRNRDKEKGQEKEVKRGRKEDEREEHYNPPLYQREHLHLANMCAKSLPA